MRKIETIIAGLCWLFVAISSIRLLIHILTNDLDGVLQWIGMSPFVLFITALLYMSGTILFQEGKQAFK